MFQIDYILIIHKNHAENIKVDEASFCSGTQTNFSCVRSCTQSGRGCQLVMSQAFVPFVK